MPQGIASHPYDTPFFQYFGALMPVEIDCVLIPVQHHPFEAPAFLFQSNACKFFEKLTTHTTTAVAWLDVKIFQIKPASV